MERKTIAERFVAYIKETWKNKIIAMILFITGIVSVFIEYDGTVCLFLWLIALILFFTKKNCIMNWLDEEEI